MSKIHNRVMFLGAKFLELVERNFPENISDDRWSNFRESVLDVVNNVVRANQSDLESYVFMPISINGGSVRISNSMIRLINNISFVDDPPSIIFYSSDIEDKFLMQHLIKIVGGGKIQKQDSKFYLVFGKDNFSMLNDLLSYLPLKLEAFDQLNKWKKEHFIDTSKKE